LKNFYAELQRRFSLIPGVRNATMTHIPMVADWNSSSGIKIPGFGKTDGPRPNTAVLQVAPKFFETMEIPILAGRPIDERDREGAQTVAVVNQVFADKYFGAESPVGRHFTFDSKEPVDVEIVGLAKTARYNSLKRDIPPVAYTAYLQAGKNRPIE